MVMRMDILTWLICLVNSVRSSSLIVWETFEFEPVTNTLPPPVVVVVELEVVVVVVVELRPEIKPFNAPPLKTLPAPWALPSLSFAIKSIQSSNSKLPEASNETNLIVSLISS